MTNIIRAVFNCNEYNTTATRYDGKPVYQYNYGQILQIHGLNLPKAVEIHFSHSMGGSEAIIRIGTTADNITEVAVPEKFLEACGTVTAYIYISDAESGQTEYKIQFQIAQRAKPEAWDSPEDGELFHQAIEAVNTSAGKAEDAAVRAEVSAGNTEQSAQDAEISATAAKTSETTVKNLVNGFSETVDNSKVDITSHTVQEKEQAISAIKAQGEEVQENISESVNTANIAKADLETAINNASTTKSQLSQAITDATTINTTLNGTIQSGNNLKQDLDASNASANNVKNNLDSSISSANSAESALDTAISNANTAKSNLDTSTSTGNTAKNNLDTTISNANNTRSELNAVISSAQDAQSSLSGVIAQASTAQTNLQNATNSATNVFNQLTAENVSAKANLDALRSEDFNAQEILSGVTDIRAYLGMIETEDVLGITMDYKNKTCTRIAGAKNLTAGADFDKFSMYGGRKRCNVSDGGTINAYYGDEGYTEDGSNGQVMVYQPKFYYLVCPLEYDRQETGYGYHLRKANYYVSETQRAGFKLHPAFYDKNGNEVDYILMSAYEGCIYDTSANAYLKNDEQVMDASTDKFSSIAGARPASGVSQNLTRPNIEQMAKNRGEGWHSFGIKTASMEQLLMIVEMGMMNLQTAIGQGVVTLPWATGSDTTSSYAGATGSTASLGNGTGRATETTTYEGGVATNNTADGKTSICYRGVENFWGNIWKFAYGVNIWGNGKMAGGMPYICSDFNYAEEKNTDNYEGAGFTVTKASGFISAMGYSTKYDWLFMASECLGNSSLPVGDYTSITENLNGYRIALLGGIWNHGSDAGGFCWDFVWQWWARDRDVGGRLVYVPTVTV